MPVEPAQRRSWPQIYRFFTEIVAAGGTYAYPEGLSSDEARALWFEQPPGQTVVAVADGVVLGSAKMGPNRPGRGSHIATAGFMTAPDQQGRGVGRVLGEYVLGWARDAGYRGMQFNAVVKGQTNVAPFRLWEDPWALQS